MQPIAIEVEPIASGWTLVVARIPPRACGANNLAAAERVRALVGAIDPRSFDPVPEAVAQAVVRDVSPEAARRAMYAERVSRTSGLSVAFDGPPNCDGHSTAAGSPGESTPRLPRANFPPYVTDDREDDEGDLAEPARYPPGVSCNITGECE